ncbi:hypothetical protein [Jannaschia pohangensis]|uniref:PAS domain-containing protein n=1 Tax=Jannaschia pohangensis TaxID=390807 RepID=A0A1I3JHI6_9RHOB|nr:hypothetical protein [Jannaschia pohangensis]SFI59707.1 hypothetical protein SAMN04488095_1327 [Jannaschia pohangensis]
MPHAATTTIASTTPISHLPPGSLDLIDDDRRRRGLLFRDGRIAALGKPLLDDLGFDADTNLRGLHFASFWAYRDRTDVMKALQRAATEDRAELSLDLAYVKGQSGCCDITLEKAPVGGLLVLTLECHD